MTEPGGRLAAGARYERVSRIATGGMGEVWRARDTVLGREVAVKVLKQEYADDAGFRDRFAAEARHAARLHHPGIAQVFDYGELDEGRTPYLVMELVDGRPLSELLSPGRPFDPEQARALVLQTAQALAAAHAAGVVHRDVKPGNLLVTPDGRVKITDFGIARAVDSASITRTGEIVGTPHYLSPEQAAGETATAASDVYALGVVLYECLAGRRPFAGETPVATALAHLRQDVPPLPETVPPDLAAITTRALAKDPAARYADGAAFAAALTDPRAAAAAVAADAGGEAVAPDATRVMTHVPTAAPAAVEAASAGPGGAEPLESHRFDRSRWPLYALLLLVLMLVVLLLVAGPWSRDDHAADPKTPQRAESPSASASASSSQSPKQVQVSKRDYVGRPVDEARADLRSLGLSSTVEEQANDGTHDPGTVADLSPTGNVDAGSSITLRAWGQPTPSTPSTQPSPGPTGPTKGHGADNGHGHDKKGD